MSQLLIGLHAGLGELGIFAFIWVFIEVLNPSQQRIKRANFAALAGVMFFFLSWLVGGYYYVNYYGDVKAVIKEGPQPWAHQIFTETKEHVFIFLPFLSIFTYSILRKYESYLKKNSNSHARKAVLFMSALIVILGVLITIMGYIISSGFRSALEAGL